MPNPKRYVVNKESYWGIELTPGEQLLLAKENNNRIRQQIKEMGDNIEFIQVKTGEEGFRKTRKGLVT